MKIKLWQRINVIILIFSLIIFNLSYVSLTLADTNDEPMVMDDSHGDKMSKIKPIRSEVHQGDLDLKIVINPGMATVGQLATISGQLTKGGVKVPNIQISIDSWHIEDAKYMYKTNFISEDGSFLWKNQFFDGAEHRLTITAVSTDKSLHFTPIKKELVIPVHAIHPPKAVAAKVIGILLGITAVGIWIGVKTSSLISGRKLGLTGNY